MGGLAQALSHRDRDAEDHGLRVVQLKRALRGAAFARGALFPLRSAISVEHFDELSARWVRWRQTLFPSWPRFEPSTGRRLVTVTL